MIGASYGRIGGNVWEKMPSLELIGGSVRVYIGDCTLDLPTASLMLRTSCWSSSSLLNTVSITKIGANFTDSAGEEHVLRISKE